MFCSILAPRSRPLRKMTCGRKYLSDGRRWLDSNSSMALTPLALERLPEAAAMVHRHGLNRLTGFLPAPTHHDSDRESVFRLSGFQVSDKVFLSQHPIFKRQR